MHSYLTAHCAFARDRSRIVRSPFAGRFPFSASPLRSRLANASGRIEFIIVLFMDWSFASGCSPPRLSTTQLPSATDRPVLLSDEDFHPIVGAYFQAHFFSSFRATCLLLSIPRVPPSLHHGSLSDFGAGFGPKGLGNLAQALAWVPLQLTRPALKGRRR
jgi:hypothetical protein